MNIVITNVETNRKINFRFSKRVAEVSSLQWCDAVCLEM